MKIVIGQIIIPWWLKWIKKYIQIKMKIIQSPTQLKGQKIDLIIVDEAY